MRLLQLGQTVIIGILLVTVRSDSYDLGVTITVIRQLELVKTVRVRSDS